MTCQDVIFTCHPTWLNLLFDFPFSMKSILLFYCCQVLLSVGHVWMLKYYYNFAEHRSVYSGTKWWPELCSMQNFTCRTKKLIGKIYFLLKYVRWNSNYIFITVLYAFMKNYNTICITTHLFHYQMDTIKLIDWMNWVNGITSELDKKLWIKNFLLLILLLFEDYTIEFCIEIYNFNLRSHFIYF